MEKDYLKYFTHELKNTAQTIVMNVQLIRKALKSNVMETQILEKLIDRLSNQTEELLINISDMDKFLKEENDADTFDLHHFIDEVVGDMNGALSHKCISLKTRFDLSIGKVFQDKRKLKIILVNLIKNAIESSLEKGEITLNTEKKDDMIFIELINSGEIKKNIRNKIFEIGFTTKENGHGLGLPFSKMLIHQIGGEIQLFTGKGNTRFSIGFPADIISYEKITGR